LINPGILIVSNENPAPINNLPIIKEGYDFINNGINNPANKVKLENIMIFLFLNICSLLKLRNPIIIPRIENILINNPLLKGLRLNNGVIIESIGGIDLNENAEAKNDK
jgi:hypothetical protein